MYLLASCCWCWYNHARSGWCWCWCLDVDLDGLHPVFAHTSHINVRIHKFVLLLVFASAFVPSSCPPVLFSPRSVLYSVRSHILYPYLTLKPGCSCFTFPALRPSLSRLPTSLVFLFQSPTFALNRIISLPFVSQPRVGLVLAWISTYTLAAITCPNEGIHRKLAIGKIRAARLRLLQLENTSSNLFDFYSQHRHPRFDSQP